MRDPETGRLGKIIEIVEERRVKPEPARTLGVPEESVMVQRMIHDVLSQLQSMGMFPLPREPLKPKMTLFLSEDEYEKLGVKLEVNEVYELEFRNGSITFRRAYD